ncbi:MAG: hypothetical protein HY891_04180 [Deltaproteobacteria bacterium]|nr:hypothetical protein [Deltaproteobacteria bacterium]
MSRLTPVKKLILLIFAVCVFSTVFSGEARSELAIGAARDVVHSQETYSGTVRYDFRSLNVGAAAWWWDGNKGDTGALELVYNIALGPVDINAGGAYLYHTDTVNGTHLNFSLGAALNLGEHFRVMFSHFSNGRGLFKWEKDKPNSGWNFLGLAYRF